MAAHPLELDRTQPALSGLLQRVFGHAGFRAHQQEVCEAAASGRDVLLVMPTGAGKSLCYQLPALALAGHTAESRTQNPGQPGSAALVVSPLIALMDDQAGKLDALGLRVARIHSGLSRDAARQACRDYLAGALDFLFIAPERMRVPGFPEMLAKRKPSLLAIDEAHCISQWGHDFRPDYRTLGQHLATLRSAPGGSMPTIALTATATPTVQRDIAVQLQLQDPAVFITGFRRDNLQVEVQELSKPQRDEYTVKLLKSAEARPAIVYAPSRKAAEELAGKLNAHFPARAYHAGLEASVREGVQRAFLGGKLEVVVATIAFGMGVDKANVRTVVHTALPGSVEAYYQEIGRAGRDGLASRTVLLYSFADRKTQEFFLERSYPPRTELERVAAALPGEWTEPEVLRKRLKLDADALARAVEKLLGHGVADQNMFGEVRATGEGRGWQPGYDAQVNTRRQQIDRMMAYAEGHSCRMAALVQHFGDRSDQRPECGMCDICRPSGEGGHVPDKAEREALRSILQAAAARSTSTGKLFTDTAVTRDRKEFDGWLGALARAGLLTIANDTFRNGEGADVTYRKVSITHEGRTPDDATLATVTMPATAAAPLMKTPTRKPKVAKKEDVPLSPEQQALDEKLRAWRLEKARDAGKPAFIIFGDSVLRAVAQARPRSLSDLERVPGIGPAKLDLYGAEMLALCRVDAIVKPDGSLVDENELRALRRSVQKGEMEEFEGRRSAVARPRRVSRVAAATGPESGTAPRRNPASPPAPVRKATERAGEQQAELTPSQQELQTRLQGWRLETAREAGLPSFFVLSDTVLRGIVVAAPRSIVELSAVRGLGTEKIERFGEAVVALCRG